MDPVILDPRFFEHFDPAQWEDKLCADLAPVMRLLLAEPVNAIATMGLENVKMPDLTVRLRQAPSAEAFAEAEAMCNQHSKLRALPGSVVCFDHYHAIEWDLPPLPPAPPKRPLLRRLFG